MKISAFLYKSKFVISALPVLAIDGISLDVWLDAKLKQPGVLDLIPAQGCVFDDQDEELAWRRLTPYSEDCSTIVPLLICPDDRDFDCAVVVAEQETTVDQVIWQRFGFAFDRPGDQVGSSVKWFKLNVSAKFNRSEFEQVVIHLKQLVDATR